MRKTLAPLLPLLLLAAVPGCKAWQVQTTASPEAFVARENPEHIRVVREDDSRTELWNPVVLGDSLRGLPTELAVRAVTIPLTDVRTVATRRFSPSRTALMLLAIGAGAFVYDRMMAVNQRGF
jgi:hypothetical protein